MVRIIRRSGWLPPLASPLMTTACTFSRTRRLTTRFAALVCMFVLEIACGSGVSEPSSRDATITIGAIGVAPMELRVKAWSRVMFVNNDVQPHTIVSDPVDIHTQCPPVNQVGLLNPGDSRSTGTLNLAGVCGFHDHANKSDSTMKGRIVVQ
jgi:plastocyanin